ncbi:MAG: hypothetical protein JO235_09725 [Chroococcidiopsidaceae cyanobacterium CP_BM_RX_35]|nr:hypothetical protein [Chroococcidiopsidaceae cyanobacterium CP_BM_RX_35]
MVQLRFCFAASGSGVPSQLISDGDFLLQAFFVSINREKPTTKQRLGCTVGVLCPSLVPIKEYLIVI